MGRARQLASNENQDRILLNASAASTDEGEHLLLDASATGTDVGFFLNTEVGTTETPPEGFVVESSLAANAVTNSKVADDAVTVSKMDSTSKSLSGRNLVINGAMNVAQRATSVTGVGGVDGYFTVDRFDFDQNTNAGRMTLTQESDGPPGFANCTKFACTTADTSLASGQHFVMRHMFEGQNLQTLKKGTGDAEPMTVSFYVKGNAPATYACELNAPSRQISKLFNVTTSWSRVELNFPADTIGAIDDDNTIGMYMIWHFGAGSDTTGGTLNSSSWAATVDANRAPGISNFFDSTDRTFFITGVQMEVGSSATPFEHKTFAQDLIECERYYFKFLEGNNQEIGAGWYYSSSHASFMFQYPTTMRATPTGIDSTGSGYYTLYANGGSDAFNSVTFENGNTTNYSALNSSEVSGTAGQCGIVRATNASSKIEFDAEL